MLRCDLSPRRRNGLDKEKVSGVVEASDAAVAIRKLGLGDGNVSTQSISRRDSCMGILKFDHVVVIIVISMRPRAVRSSGRESEYKKTRNVLP